ncbi:MAG TPA: hypothetical protein VF808_01965 [Ktedonobacterales bacterium]
MARHHLTPSDHSGVDLEGLTQPWGMEASGWMREETQERITVGIPQTLKRICAAAQSQGATPEDVARRLAETCMPVDSAD